jgi:hypothetical protein
LLDRYPYTDSQWFADVSSKCSTIAPDVSALRGISIQSQQQGACRRNTHLVALPMLCYNAGQRAIAALPRLVRHVGIAARSIGGNSITKCVVLLSCILVEVCNRCEQSHLSESPLIPIVALPFVASTFTPSISKTRRLSSNVGSWSFSVPSLRYSIGVFLFNPLYLRLESSLHCFARGAL